MSVGRDWNGGVYQKKDGSSWYVKLRRWEDRHKTDPWSKRKGFATKTKANACLRAAKDEYDLKERGMWNEARDGDIAPIAIAHLIEAFEVHVRSNSAPRPRHDPEKHVKLIAARLRKAFEAMSVESLNDLKKPDNANAKTPSDKAATFLNAMLRNRAVIDKRCLKANEQSGGASIKTRNDYMATLKQFGRWLEETERLHRSPFAILRKIDGEPKQRQVLTWEQVRDLASAAIQRTLQSRARDANKAKHMRSARRRAMAVMLGFLAGLRRQEIENLRWSWIDSDTITIAGEFAKSKSTESVPLHDGLRALLAGWRKLQAVEMGRSIRSTDLVVTDEPERGTVPALPEHIAERLRDDAAWAEIEHESDKLLDLHSMRTSLANALDEDVPDSIISELLRHRTGGVTRKHYRKRDAAKLGPFINEIPAECADVPGLLEELGTHAGTQVG